MSRLAELSDDGLSEWLVILLYPIGVSTYWMSDWMGGCLGGSVDAGWSCEYR